MYPDGGGVATERGFYTELLAVQPNALIVPALNGPDRAKLTNLTWEMRKHNSNVIPVCSFEPGLLNALIAGYRCVLDIIRMRKLGNVPIVRLDTAEHDPRCISSLVQEAIDGRVVVGDLVFTDKTLLPGTPDYDAHLREWPEMFGAATGNRLGFSCAHGLSFFGAGTLETVFQGALKLKRVVEEDFKEKPLWGWDSAMFLSAVGEGLTVKRVAVPATQVRNRSLEKIDAQRQAARLWIKAAHVVYPHLAQ